ncbi:replication initiation protein, partial [Staphylococcus aureus]
FNDLHILKPDWKTIQRTSDRAMLFMLLSEEEEWGKLERRTKNKYKNLIKEISPIDLTDLMKSTLKANEKQLQKQIEFWQRDSRFF